MASPSAPRRYRTLIAAASLIAGPLLMTIGDLLHPAERMAPSEQIAILVDHASRWYTAHLLLFIGLMLFIPGLLALSALTGARKPVVGYAARILILMGAAGLASIFVAEMLVGRFVLDGADPAVATDLLESMFSGPMLVAVGPAMLAFFIGTAAFALPLMRTGSKVGWPAALILLGALLIFAEIVSAQVVLSKIGNVLAFCVAAAAAWLILRGTIGETAELS
ncbi:MAG TPA: hypothetical protein VFH40_03450 [Gemmatimonadales bacterium]|nr:hypothetical protein [Gemmatimonadales bacterium]